MTSFYKKAVTDILIGHHFRKIDEGNVENPHPLFPDLQNFSHHIPRIIDFWLGQLDIKKNVSRNENSGKDHNSHKPFALIKTHHKLSIRQGELDRWVALFFQTLEDEIEEHENLSLKEIERKWKDKVTFFKKKFEEALL